MTSAQKTILIVDDEPDIVYALSTILEDAGYVVVTVVRSDNLMRRLRDENRPDLILLDMLLSGQRGSEIVSALKGHLATRHIPIVMLSAHPNAAREALAAGTDDFLAKPFDLDDLLAIVAAHL